jgi:uncharacterized protein (DUF433 family)
MERKATRNGEIAKLYEGGESLWDIGRRYGVTGEAIRKVLKRQGIERRPAGKPRIRERIAEQAAEMYAAGLSTHAIASELDCAQETVRAALVDARVTLRKPTAAQVARVLPK